MMGSTTLKIRFSSIAIVVAVAVAVATLAGCSNQPAPTITTETDRVQQAFHRMSVDVAQKDGVTSVELTPVRAGGASFPDGTTASLWVTGPTPTGIHSRCFYVDITVTGSLSTFGRSGCGGPGKNVSLSRDGSIVIGDIETWPAQTVQVSANGITAQPPVTSGYFIVPSELSTNPKAKFTIELMDGVGKSLGTVTDLLASASATPH